MNKLIFITSTQLCPREVDFFCLDELKEFYELEYWDCSSFLFPNFKVPEFCLNEPYSIEVKNLREFRSLIKKQPKDARIIVDVFSNKNNYQFYKILGHFYHHVLTIFFSANTITLQQEVNSFPITQKKSFLYKIKQWLYQPFIIKIIVQAIKHLGKSDFKKRIDELYSNRIHSFIDFTIISTRSGFDRRINHPDYEKFLKYTNAKPLIDNPYIVFIDEYFPYLKEVMIEDPLEKVDEVASMYYDSMNSFFCKVEKKYQKEIVIAAHPRSNYERSNPFNGRKIFYNQTVNLIKGCEAVLIHNSNCYSFVALYNKPVAALINKAWRRSTRFTRFVIDINTSLNINIIDTDLFQLNDDNIFIKISEDIRAKYIDTFLCEKNNNELNVNKFKKIYDEF